ncbi:MAG: hypothetical protein RJA36_1184 [Pseudomonadota bacterium]|jgi:hypothetical protein
MAQMFTLQQKRYPKAFAFLSAALPDVIKSEKTLAAFLTYSCLTPQEAQQALRMDTVSPLIFASDLGPVIYGQFDPQVPDRIEIAIEVLTRFEAVADSSLIVAQQFLLAKVLHEMCHWGCCRKQIEDNDSAGEEFEAKLYGSELIGWWREPCSTISGGAGTPFTDPQIRAVALKSLLSGRGFAPGRSKDPDHAVCSGDDVAQGMPRGFRNNNPGNIRKSTSAWRGLADPADMKPFQRNESNFCVFREPEWGLRAMAYLLRDYQSDHGLDTPRKIISRWAPATDNNDVDSYADALARALGVQADDRIDTTDDATLITMLQAISRHENGDRSPYTRVQYQTALLLLA